MIVRSVMVSHSTITIDSTWTLAEISRFFENMETDYLTIVKDEQFIGILSREHFYRYLDDSDLSHDRMSSTSVLEATERSPFYCEPEHDVRDALTIMQERGLGYLMVKSFGKIVGVVSFTSVAAAVASRLTPGRGATKG